MTVLKVFTAVDQLSQNSKRFAACRSFRCSLVTVTDNFMQDWLQAGGIFDMAISHMLMQYIFARTPSL